MESMGKRKHETESMARAAAGFFMVHARAAAGVRTKPPHSLTSRQRKHIALMVQCRFVPGPQRGYRLSLPRGYGLSRPTVSPLGRGSI